MPPTKGKVNVKDEQKLREKWSLASSEARKLKHRLEDKHADAADINGRITKYRARCDPIIVGDINYAVNKDVENELWDIHTCTNAWYRRQLETFKRTSKRKHAVEQRKTSKRFLEFIKSSQHYYRGHIQKLAQNFSGIPELEAVALKVTIEDLTEAQNEVSTTDHRSIVLTSCFLALIHLGDLSRWREEQRLEGEANWGPAIGFYDLASVLRPESGIPHNQLAVIASRFNNPDNLRIVYHFYRSLTAPQPHPNAEENLDREFRKIMAQVNSGKSFLQGTSEESRTVTDLIGWTLTLHAKCKPGNLVVDYEDMAESVVGWLVDSLKNIAMPSIFKKIVLINLAAEQAASEKAKLGSPGDATHTNSRCVQATYYFLKLNIKTSAALLYLLLKELREGSDGGTDGNTLKKATEKVTPVMHRILPGIRHYSSWLHYNLEPLVADFKGLNSFLSAMEVDIRDLWRVYSRVLTLIVNVFDADDLPAIDYLFEEDEETIGFAPFQIPQLRERFLNGSNRKPSAGSTSRHHPTKEMLGRLRDLVHDGIRIAKNPLSPITVSRGSNSRPVFRYKFAAPTSPSPPRKLPPVDNAAPVFQSPEEGASAVGPKGRDKYEEMVEELVTDDADPSDIQVPFRFYPPRTRTPPAYSFEDPQLDINPFEPSVGGEDGDIYKDVVGSKKAMKWLKGEVDATGYGRGV